MCRDGCNSCLVPLVLLGILLWADIFVNFFNGDDDLGFESKFVRLSTDMVRAYQRLAPRWVRQQCVYHPCCSDYMITCLEKHGFVRGITRGIMRILRCRRPYGGTDLP